MKTTLMYGTTCRLTIIDRFSWHWELAEDFHMLQDAVNKARDIFNGLSQFDPDNILSILILDINTGEILTECEHDDQEEYDPWVEEIDNPNYDPAAIWDVDESIAHMEHLLAQYQEELD